MLVSPHTRGDAPILKVEQGSRLLADARGLCHRVAYALVPRRGGRPCPPGEGRTRRSAPTVHPSPRALAWGSGKPIGGLVCLLAILVAVPLAGCAPAANLTKIDVGPGVISPNGDGADDQATIAYGLSRKSQISIMLVNGSGEEYSFRRDETRAAGSYAARFSGTYYPDPSSPQRRVMPDGEYSVVVRAVPVDKDGVPEGTEEERKGRIVIQGADTEPPVVKDVVSRYPVISPDGDALEDETDISYSLSKKATVTIDAVDAAGERYLLEPPTERSAALYSHVWNGTSTGRLLPDGAYTIQIQAQDVAGNLSESTARVAIEGGGTPSLEITRVRFSPTAVLKGKNLEVEIRVRNSGKVPLRTIGPEPGTAYDTGMNFNFWTGADGQPIYFERAGVWRVGVEWGQAGRPYPVRWGLTPDLSDLQPGQEAVITGTIKVDIDQNREVYFWASAVQEGVGFPGGRVGQQKIVVSY